MPKQAPGQKGHSTKITGGSHKGSKGWLDDSRQSAPCKMPICFINSKNGDTEDWTSIGKPNVRNYDPNDQPKNYVEAALEQNPKADDAIEEAARQLAKCHVGDDAQKLDDAADHFKAIILDYHTIHRGMKSNADWKEVKCG